MMSIDYNYNTNKVWEFMEHYNLIPENNYLNAKELYEEFIENNPKILIKYSEFKYSGNNEPHFKEIEVYELRKNITQTKLNNLNENINEEIPTYYDIQYWNSSKIFEAEEVKESKANPEDLQKAEEFYNNLVESLKEGKDLDEGFLTGLLGGAAGALVGPAVGKAICKILGIDMNGHLGKLLTSRLVTTAIGYELGK